MTTQQFHPRHILFAVLALVTLWMARDFILPFAWAVILAVALWPYCRGWIAGTESRTPRPILASLAVTAATALVVIVPLAIAVFEAAVDGNVALQWLDRAQRTGIPPPERLMELGAIGERINGWWLHNLSNPRTAGTTVSHFLLGSASTWAAAIGSDLMARSFVLVMVLLFLFFLLRHGITLSDRMLTASGRLFGPFGRDFVTRLAAAIRQTVNGTIIVALAEGALIGAAYVIAGVPHPFLFAILTTACAMLPFGAWIAFTIASAVVLYNGNELAAGLLFSWGALVMMIGDNFGTPWLIGSKVRLPFLWALVGTFGGIATFGLVGLFLGPVIVVAARLAWEDLVEHPDPPLRS